MSTEIDQKYYQLKDSAYDMQTHREKEEKENPCWLWLTGQYAASTEVNTKTVAPRETPHGPEQCL